jgi:hypothetical protein
MDRELHPNLNFSNQSCDLRELINHIMSNKLTSMHATNDWW